MFVGVKGLREQQVSLRLSPSWNFEPSDLEDKV
jgi:hypothetical protein